MIVYIKLLASRGPNLTRSNESAPLSILSIGTGSLVPLLLALIAKSNRRNKCAHSPASINSKGGESWLANVSL